MKTSLSVLILILSTLAQAKTFQFMNKSKQSVYLGTKSVSGGQTDHKGWYKIDAGQSRDFKFTSSLCVALVANSRDLVMEKFNQIPVAGEGFFGTGSSAEYFSYDEQEDGTFQGSFWSKNQNSGPPVKFTAPNFKEVLKLKDDEGIKDFSCLTYTKSDTLTWN